MAAEWVWQEDEERWDGKGLWKCHGCLHSFPATVLPLMRMYADDLGWALCPHCAELPPRPNQTDVTFAQLVARNLRETGRAVIRVTSPATLTQEEEKVYARQKHQEEDQGQWHSFAHTPHGQWYIDGKPLP